jgi:glutathione reductase (NADPH)
VAIAEQGSVGGTCVTRGCIPEKLMSFAAELSEDSQVATGYGWNKPQHTFDCQQFIATKEREIHHLSKVHNQKLEKIRVERIKGCGTFVDAHTLDVGGGKITADKILITVGQKT